MDQYLPLKNNRIYSPVLSGLEIGLPPGQVVPEPQSRDNYINKPLPEPPVRISAGLEMVVGPTENRIPPRPIPPTGMQHAPKGMPRKIAQLTGEAIATVRASSSKTRKVQQLTGYDLDIVSSDQRMKQSGRSSSSSSSAYSDRSASPVELAGDSVSPERHLESSSSGRQVIRSSEKDNRPLDLKMGAYSASTATVGSKVYKTDTTAVMQHEDQPDTSSDEDTTWASTYVGFTRAMSVNDNRNRIDKNAVKYESIHHVEYEDISPQKDSPPRQQENYQQSLRGLVPQHLSLRPKTVESQETKSESRFSDHSSEDEQSLASQMRDSVLRGLRSPFRSSKRASQLSNNSRLGRAVRTPSPSSAKRRESTSNLKSFGALANPLRSPRANTPQPTFSPAYAKPNSFSKAKHNSLSPSIAQQSTFPPSNAQTRTFSPSNAQTRTFSPSNAQPRTFSPSNAQPRTFSPSNGKPSSFSLSNVKSMAISPSNVKPNTFSPSYAKPGSFARLPSLQVPLSASPPVSPSGATLARRLSNAIKALTNPNSPHSDSRKPSLVNPTPVNNAHPNPHPAAPRRAPSYSAATSRAQTPTNPAFARRRSSAVRNFGGSSNPLGLQAMYVHGDAGTGTQADAGKGKQGFMARVVEGVREKEGELVAGIGDFVERARGKVRAKGEDERRREWLRERIVVIGKVEQGPDGVAARWV